MSILYVIDQGAYLSKDGARLVIKKAGNTIQWVHASEVDQVVLMGNISISPGAISFLLQEGIDTVFMSFYGKYRGRLISQFGKNIELRRIQFKHLEDEKAKLKLAKLYIHGKLNNCRTLLRSHNRDINDPDIISALHHIRMMIKRIEEVDSVDSLMGIEGQSASTYFGCFGKMIKVDDIIFNGRNRRPPKDPVNVLLSLGYTLLMNTIQTQVNIAGLDPYIGFLHSVEYGRPSLILDIMEEFRPVLVDALVLSIINKKIIRLTDFYKPDEREPAAFEFAEQENIKKDYPIILTHEGMKKFILHFETRLNQKVLYMPKSQKLTYKDICLEQVRLLVRNLKGESEYLPYFLR